MDKLTSLSLTLLLMLIFPIVESCESTNEGCDSDTLYYDYSNLEIEQQENTGDANDAYMYFWISPVMDIETHIPAATFGSSLMAANLIFISKYEIEKISIFSNKDFATGEAALTEVTNNIEFFNGMDWLPLDEATFGDEGHMYLRCIQASEDTDLSYDLTIEIIKSNKKNAIGKLRNVSFKN